ncbi:hypothetical protein FHR92_002860 [Fontibacillus solani]|uniref:Uncharacterized protein n=1 Tax=Fontibacillus solani TaxID=1572857 RepID=A0A7W3SUB3_9BACL|nr:ATP-binding protein [Fontibacillus solani]MBA9086382.1 hypothetical protein [Fontibacillus solani]
MISPGIADPYWYEWYVGLSQVIRMIDYDNDISCVIFQKGDYKTIDDVVVKYKNGTQEYCYQVKHEIETLNNKALTFNKLITIEQNDKSTSKSLINALATGWNEVSLRTGNDITPILYTNRTLGSNRTQRTFKGSKYQAIPLGEFIVKIKKKITETGGTSKLTFTETEDNLHMQWQEFSDAINLPDDLMISFLSKLTVEASQASLSELRESQVTTIGKLFGCSHEIAEKLFNRLVAELPVWTTSTRSSEEITVETVFEALSTKLEISNEQHRLAPPSPFFKSREEFCRDVVAEIGQATFPLVFISGDPGSGKTSIVSHIQSAYNLFTIRYHAFRPISPEQRFYNADMGLCEPRQLWTELMVQIRARLKGKLYKHSVPVICDHISDINLRSEVLRLLGVISEETRKTVYICIDGIDHAARSNLPVTFLSSLYSPSEIPKGVCFVIVGQPSNLYDKYPSWLQVESSSVKYIEIPPLEKEDIVQLVIEKAPQYSRDSERVSELIYSLTKGNNLSVVYAIESIKKFTTFEELIDLSVSGLISSDVNQYYGNIWRHVTEVIIKKNILTSFAEAKVADAILLLNGRIYTRLLHEALKDMSLSLSEWNQLMDSLYPLVVPDKTEHEYNLFHNDFRVYLMSVGTKYPQIYKELSYQIAQYLHESDWGIVKYKNVIPLLICADKFELTADYFDVSFVINALAEGISSYELDAFASIAYSEAVKSRHILKYHSVYLALTTLHQHRKYYEHYGRIYKSEDLHEVIPIDISEMRALTLSKESIEDYHHTLIRCKRLYATDAPDMHRRAISLYELWFGSLTPVSFIRALYPHADYPENYTTETSIKELLTLWGEISAQFNLKDIKSLRHEANELHDYEIHAEIMFGNAYFSYFIEHELFEEAIAGIENVRTSINCVSEKLESIWLNGKAHLFVNIIEILQAHKLKEEAHLFASAILLMVDPIRKDKIKPVELNEPIKHIYDSNSLNAVAIAYIIGVQNASRDDIVLINQVYTHLNIMDDSGVYKREITYLKLLMRIAALLGKYNYLLAKLPDKNIDGRLLYQQLHTFFGKPAVRSFEFTKAFRFLLHTILNTSSIEKIIDLDVLCADLKHTLLTFQSIGMHYKSIILEFLMKHDRLDIVQEYLLALYGTTGELLCQQEDWASTHNHFLKYSSVVIPEISSSLSARLKWDVVSYSGHEETAINMPLEIYKICAHKTPGLWETQGIRLNAISVIADNFSNEYSNDVAKTLNKNAVHCGISSFWKLHHLDSNYHYNLNILHEQLDDLLVMAHNEQDIIAIWILACGMLSWYNKSDRATLQNIYDICTEYSKILGGHTFIDFVAKYTPTQFTIANDKPVTLNYSNSLSEDDYYIKKKERNRAFEQEISGLPINEIIEYYVNTVSHLGEWDNIDISWKEILRRGEMSSAEATHFMNVIAPKLEDRQWKNYGCDYIISQLKEHLKYDAFWELSGIIGARLSEYDYQTSTRNASFLLLLYSDMFADDMLSLLDAELHCQELWISGDGHIPFPTSESTVMQNLLQPKNLHELSLNVLLEQFELNNVHRNEIALPAIYALCISEPSLYNWIVHNWEALVSEQKDAVILICERWGREAPVGIEKLINTLEEEYEKSNRLTEKMKLYSILAKFAYARGTLSEPLTLHASPEQYKLTMPKPYTLIDDSNIPIGIKAFLDLNSRATHEYDTGLDIIKFVRENTGAAERKNEQYSRSGDCILVRNPGMYVIDPILYGEELLGRWDHLPFEWRMQYFLDVDDAWVTTIPPTVIDDEIWNIESELEECLKDDDNKKAESIAQAILHTGLSQDEQLLGASLWYPVGHYDNGIILFYTLKTICSSSILCSNRINQTFINYSMLADTDDLYEYGLEDISKDGICLVRSIVGSAQFILGNCQIYPSSFLQEKFKWTPLFSNPFVWVDDKAERVLKFERILYPKRDTLHQHYHRQPMLFRWVADKNKLESQLKKHELVIRAVYDTLPYDSILKGNED